MSEQKIQKPNYGYEQKADIKKLNIRVTTHSLVAG